jgi:hypothetical protein
VEKKYRVIIMGLIILVIVMLFLSNFAINTYNGMIDLGIDFLE